MGHNHGVFDSDTRFTINPITRQIRSESRKATVIQFDHNSERFTFECPRRIEGHDMSVCNRVEVHYINIDPKTKAQNTGVYVADDLQVSPDDSEKVVCSWLISQNATQIIGALNFIVCYKCIENGECVYAWNTAISSVSVSDGINATESVATEYADVLEQWRAELYNAGYINASTMQNEVNTLKSRMDSFVALKDGSTTGDAELIDARIGANGVTYASAGEASREQFKGLYELEKLLFESGDNLISLENKDLSGSISGTEYSLIVENGRVIVNGTLAGSVRIKLTNGIAKGITNAPNSWFSETAPFEIGKTYISKAHHISGTVQSESGEDKASGVVVSARSAENAVLFSDSKGAVEIAETVSHVQLFLPFGVYDNAVFLPVVEEGETITAPEDLKTRYLSKNVGLKHQQSDLSSLIKALTYSTVVEFNHKTIHEDKLEHYADNQGMCSDGDFLYYSLRREAGDAANTILKKYNIATGEVVLTVENRSYGHANGMAYIPHENALYIVKMDTAGTVFKVDADTLEYIGEFSLKEVLTPVVEWYMGVGAVAYDATREKIVFLLRGVAEGDGRTRKGFAVFDKEMRFEKVIKTPYIECESYSGLATDENFIYLTITNPHTGDGEFLIAYDWHGNVVYKTEISYFNHLEALALVGGDFFFSYNHAYRGAHIVRCSPLVTGSVYKANVMAQYNLNE